MTAQDLTAITTPFGLLDAETQAALRAHCGDIEVYAHHGWRVVNMRCWTRGNTYRARPATKPSIDWSHVAEGFNWLARDEGGICYVYNTPPTEGKETWRDKGVHFAARYLASYTPGACDWKDSLVCRPGYDGDAA